MQYRGQLTTAEAVRRFANAGNATLTLVSKTTGARFTYKIQAPYNDEGKRDDASQMRFVKVLTGADNESAYSYLGYLRRDLYIHGGAKAKVGRDTPSAKAFEWAWQRFVKDTMPESLEVWHEGKCAACGRKLTVPSSVATGFGPDCAERLGIPVCEVIPEIVNDAFEDSLDGVFGS
jgi:hypothetical protein